MTGFSLTRRRIVLGTAGALAGSALLSAGSEAKPATADGPWAVELFTSQEIGRAHV